MIGEAFLQAERRIARKRAIPLKNSLKLVNRSGARMFSGAGEVIITAFTANYAVSGGQFG
jgi:hypothetical protein